MLNLTYERNCPYCHAALSERVDADTHIIGCSDRWREHHHVDPPTTRTTLPTQARCWRPSEAMPDVMSGEDIARRVVAASEAHTQGFRSLPAYEPAA